MYAARTNLADDMHVQCGLSAQSMQIIRTINADNPHDHLNYPNDQSAIQMRMVSPQIMIRPH